MKKIKSFWKWLNIDLWSVNLLYREITYSVVLECGQRRTWRTSSFRRFQKVERLSDALIRYNAEFKEEVVGVPILIKLDVYKSI